MIPDERMSSEGAIIFLLAMIAFSFSSIAFLLYMSIAPDFVYDLLIKVENCTNLEPCNNETIACKYGCERGVME